MASAATTSVERRVRLDIGVVRLDGVDDLGALAVATCEVGADDGMRALDLVVDGLAEVMQKTGALGGRGSSQARRP